QDDRQARLPHGADPPPFRAARLDRAASRDPLLDRRGRARADRPDEPEAQIDMTPATSMRGETVAVFGLGGSGLATGKALRSGGATAILWDDAPARVEEARNEGFAVADLREADWRSFAALVLAPGVPLTHPKPHWTVELAKASGVEVIGDIELFCRERA